MIIQNR